MAALAPLIRGSLQAHPLAERFAVEVHRVHRRYASEVVAQNQLCPFLRDVDTGFGRFCVMLDAEPDVPTAIAAVLAAGTSVIHLVYPCTSAGPSSPFEKFAGKLAAALKQALPEAPVMATFHPALPGEGSNPFRLVGLLRRAPDPFVQLIPEGLHKGGTMFAGTAELEAATSAHALDPAQANFAKMRGGLLEELVALMAEIRADRDRSYAPFLEALGVAQPA
jgi:hypothetical protein